MPASPQPAEAVARRAKVRLPAPLVAGVGVVLLVGVIMYAAVAHAPFNVYLLGLAVAGGLLQVAAPFLDAGQLAHETGIGAQIPAQGARSRMRNS